VVRLAEAIDGVETTQERCCEAELHRFKGELLETDSDCDQAGACFLDALAAHAIRMPGRGSFAPASVSPVFGAIRLSGRRLASFSLRFTAGLPQASIRSI
jgi:hypothetical protein